MTILCSNISLNWTILISFLWVYLPNYTCVMEIRLLYKYFQELAHNMFKNKYVSFCCCMLFCRLLIFFKIIFFPKNSFKITMKVSVWIKIRSDIMSGLIWVQAVCKGYQQTTKVGRSYGICLFVFFRVSLEYT